MSPYHKPQKAVGVLCPECSSPMYIRTRRADGVDFYGCSMYPDCRGTRDIDEQDRTEPDYDELRKDMPSSRARENDRRRWKS